MNVIYDRFVFYDKKNNCYVKLNESIFSDAKNFVKQKAKQIKTDIKDTFKQNLEEKINSFFSEIDEDIKSKIKAYTSLDNEKIKNEKGDIVNKIKDLFFLIINQEIKKMTLDELKDILKEDGFKRFKKKIIEIDDIVSSVVNNDKIDKKKIESVFNTIKEDFKKGKTIEEIVSEKFEVSQQAKLIPFSYIRDIADKAVVAGEKEYQNLLNLWCKNKGLTEIYSDNNLEVYLINTQQAAIAVGGYVDWCTSRGNESENLYFAYRDGGLCLFYFPFVSEIKDCVGLNKEASGLEFSEGILNNKEKQEIIYDNIKNNKYSHQHGVTSFEFIDFEGFDFTGLNVKGFSFLEARNVNNTITKALNTDEAIFFLEQNENEYKCYFDEETFKTKEEQLWLAKKIKILIKN